MNIANKVAIITGGASGMGAETARHLATLKTKIAILDNNIEAAKQVAEELGGLAVECDISDSVAVEKAINSVIKAFSCIHIAVNCAGIAPAARIVGREGPMPLDDFNRAIQINLVGTFNVMRLVAAQMIAQEAMGDDGERGVIINTASVAAFEGQIGQAAYSASKGGIVALTLPAAREFAKFGIRVMAIAPGVIATPMMATMTDEVAKSLSDSVPFPKRLGKPSEYAHLVQHIIENAYLNGEVIRLDGGLRMSGR